MKTPEEVIKDIVGIKPGARPLTPMDYNECKMCMKEYAKQWIDKASEIPTLEIDHYPIQKLKEEIDAQ